MREPRAPHGRRLGVSPPPHAVHSRLWLDSLSPALLCSTTPVLVAVLSPFHPLPLHVLGCAVSALRFAFSLGHPHRRQRLMPCSPAVARAPLRLRCPRFPHPPSAIASLLLFSRLPTCAVADCAASSLYALLFPFPAHISYRTLCSLSVICARPLNLPLPPPSASNDLLTFILLLFRSCCLHARPVIPFGFRLSHSLPSGFFPALPFVCPVCANVALPSFPPFLNPSPPSAPSSISFPHARSSSVFFSNPGAHGGRARCAVGPHARARVLGSLATWTVAPTAAPRPPFRRRFGGGAIDADARGARGGSGPSATEVLCRPPGPMLPLEVRHARHALQSAHQSRRLSPARVSRPLVASAGAPAAVPVRSRARTNPRGPSARAHRLLEPHWHVTTRAVEGSGHVPCPPELDGVVERSEHVRKSERSNEATVS